jgi:hypothetical protein
LPQIKLQNVLKHNKKGIRLNAERLETPIMKLTLSFLAVVVAIALYANAQTFVTNKINSANAAKIASRLKPGMSENEMTSILETNGLAHGVAIGSKVGAKWCYFLSDGYTLSLDVNINPNGWTNRILQSACIQSNGSPISITLTNR